jgi:hypothetical protein
MGLLNWLKSLFKRRKTSELIYYTFTTETKPTAEPKLTTAKGELIGRGDKIMIKYEVPITHPAKYGKFFKKRQPTTARKLWKKNAKIDDEDEDDVNVIFREDD